MKFPFSGKKKLQDSNLFKYKGKSIGPLQRGSKVKEGILFFVWKLKGKGGVGNDL